MMPSGPAWSETGDSDSVICAVTTTTQCANPPNCTSVEGDGALPTLLRFDLEKRQLTSTKPEDRDQVTPIHVIQPAGDNLHLMGIDDGVGWMAVISIQTGKMVMTLSDPELTILGTGECTIP
jgi:hypothetical protein